MIGDNQTYYDYKDINFEYKIGDKEYSWSGYAKETIDALKKNMYLHNAVDWGRLFNRMQTPTPYFGIPNTREYVFFTKPDLHIIDTADYKNELNPEIADRFFWRDMFFRYRRVIADLQASAIRDNQERDKHIFIPMLTNAVNSSLELPNSSAETIDSPSNIYGTTIQYRGSSQKSDEGFDFSLDFIDMPGMDVYYLFKMWDEYENLKSLGIVSPPSKDENSKTINKYNLFKGKGAKDIAKSTGMYRANKILHDQIAIYKFVVDGSDAETILFYAKYTGCFPKSVPRDAFSNFKGEGLLTYSVDWHAQFVEDSNPEILAEFATLCRAYLASRYVTTKNINKDDDEAVTALTDKTLFIDKWNDEYDIVNGAYAAHPYIIKQYQRGKNTQHYNNAFPSKQDDRGAFVYKLKWIKEGFSNGKEDGLKMLAKSKGDHFQKAGSKSLKADKYNAKKDPYNKEKAKANARKANKNNKNNPTKKNGKKK